MKNFKNIIITICILVSGCADNNLDVIQATELIRKSNEYPKVIEHYIFCGDPAHASKALDAGLEEKGLVTIVKFQKLRDVGKPLVIFKDKADPYLLPTSDKDRTDNIQKLKIGTEEFNKVTNVKVSADGKKAIAAYKTIWHTNVFAALQQPLKKKEERKAYFLLTQNGWEIVTAAEFELLN